MKTWWLSFADRDGFRGVVLVDDAGDDLLLALSAVNLAGCNPHGQVHGVQFSGDEIDEPLRSEMAALPRLKLLGLKDLLCVDPVNTRGERPA